MRQRLVALHASRAVTTTADLTAALVGRRGHTGAAGAAQCETAVHRGAARQLDVADRAAVASSASDEAGGGERGKFRSVGDAERGKFRSVGDAELAVYVGEVGLDRAPTHEEAAAVPDP